MRALVVILCAAALSSPLFASDCPYCEKPSPSACRRVGSGQAKFLWSSGDAPSSGITLTSGSCGQGGESATGYILMHTNTHYAVCNNKTACDDGFGENKTIAIIRVTGNEKAFQNTLGSIGFIGDKVYGGGQYSQYYSSQSVTRTNCDYALELSGSSAARIKVSASVGQCDPQYANSRFQIMVKFYQVLSKPQSPDAYTLLTTTTGSIAVKNNQSRDFDPVSFIPDFRDKSIMDLKPILRNYSEAGGQSTWMLRYTSPDWEYSGCSSQQGWCGPWGGIQYNPMVPAQETFYRVKYPGMESSVQGQPNYIKDSGWNYESSGNRLVYDMGNQGKMYYHLQPAANGSVRVRTVERVADGQSAGQGQIEWTVTYDELNRVKYIQNASYADPNNLPDPNYIDGSTQCYVYEYTGDSENPLITFKTRPSTASAWQDSRRWQVEFDEEGRAIKYQDGCGGCSGGTGNFEHIAYHPDFEDEIAWRKNADGTILVENTYQTFEFGQYEPAGWIYVPDGGFEWQDVDLNDCALFNNPFANWGWQHAGGSVTAEICDPNGSQYLSFTEEADAVFQGLYPVMLNTRYRLDVLIRAHVGQADSFATVVLSAFRVGSSEELGIIDLVDLDMPEGSWIEHTLEWDSKDYPDLYDPLNPYRLKIELFGKKVDMDNVRLSTAIWVGAETKPIITEQKVYAHGYATPQTALKRSYVSDRDTDLYRMIERHYVQAGSAACRVVIYDYTDDSFATLAKKTEFSHLGTSTGLPAGESFETVYSGNDPNAIYLATFPNEKRANFERYANGNLVESYVLNLDNDANSLREQFEYIDLGWDSGEWKLKKHTNSRGGVTEYEYYTEPEWRGLIKKQTDPNTSAGQQVTQFYYDGARRLIRQTQKLDSERTLTTVYNYNPKTGFLDSVTADGVWTSYYYNHFGQVIREVNTDRVVTGKSYGLGGELLSEFVVSENTADPNSADTSLTLISQTRYTYTANGQIELMGRYKSDDEFAYQSDMTAHPDNWIITKYEYYPDGKRKKTIEDYGTERANLTTEYFYNLQGEIEKIVYPTGKWVKTIRDGRGQRILEQTGYGADNVALETAFDYNANGNLQWQKNPDGTEVYFTYDNYDRLKRIYQGSLSGPYSEHFYNDAGDVIRQIACEADGTILSDKRMDYDLVRRLIYERICAEPNTLDDLKDNITHYLYDIAGNLRKQIKAGLENEAPSVNPASDDIVTEYVYNDQGRRIATIDPKGIVYSVEYTDGGLPEKIISPVDPSDPNAFITQRIYAHGRLEKTIDPMGHYTINSYNSLNQLIKQISYDCNGTPEDYQDDFAVRQRRMEYDHLGNVRKQIVMADPASSANAVPGVDSIVEFTYQNGLLYQQKTYYGTTAAAAVTTFYYDQIDRRYRTVDPQGNEEVITFYTDGIKNALVQKVEQKEVNSEDPQDFYTITTFLDYDDFGRVFREILDTDGDGVKESADQTNIFTYDALNRPKTQTANDGVVTYFDYDGFGNVKQKIDDYGNQDRTTEFVYNRLNQQYQIIALDPNDTTSAVDYQITTYEYDKNGNATKILYPDGKFVQYEYNLLNKVGKETKRDETEIYYGYWWSGRLWFKSDHPDGPDGYPSLLTTFEYNAAGDLKNAYKEINGSEVSDSTFTYNGFGAKLSETARYDNLLTKTTSWTYDGSGNRLTQTHGGTTLTYTHDGLGRIKTIDKGDSQIVSYSYLGRNTQSIDYTQADTSQTFGYDEVGRIIQCQSTDPDSLPILDFIYTYDNVGNRDSVKYNHLPTPVWDKYYYDSLNRLWKAEYGQPFGFASTMDNLVLFASAWLDNMSTDYTNFFATENTEIHRDKKISVHSCPFVAKEYSQAEIAQIKRQILSIARKVNDPHMAKLVDSITTVTPIAYNPDAPLLTLSEFGEKIPADYRGETCRDEDGKIIAQIVWDNQDRMVLFAMYPDSGDTVVVTTAYGTDSEITSNTLITFDSNGNIIETIDLLAQQQLDAQRAALASLQGESLVSLDGGMMLMSSTPESSSAKIDQFGYDHLGNRTAVYLNMGQMAQETQEYAHNIVNQYTSIERSIIGLPMGGTVGYDDNGNLLYDVHGRTFAYDYRNRLIAVDDSSATIAEYTFDALGRRISKTVGSTTTTYFFYDPQGRVITEYESGTLQRQYVYGNGYNEVLAMFLPEYEGNLAHWDAFMEFVNAWLCQSPDACYDATYDHNSDGKINLADFAYFAGVWDLPSNTESNFYYLHDALGSVRGLIGGRFHRESDREFYNYDVYGNSSDVSAIGNPFGFSGYRYDAETGHYHTDNRAYDPETGRWLQFDPLGTDDSMNLYEYVRGNPVMYVDPLGLATMHWSPGGVGFPSEYQQINIADSVPESLSTKIMKLLALRASRGVALPFNIYNRFRQNYDLKDELNEMNQVFGGDIERYYIDVVIHNRHSLKGEQWQKINFPPPSPKFREWSPGAPGLSEIPGLGFWLGGPHQVSANGCFEAKCCGTKCSIKNIDTNFEWRDQIDANSFIELKSKPAGMAEKLLEGGLGDLVGDKFLGMSYYITIRWKHVDKLERPINIEPRLKKELERNQK